MKILNYVQLINSVRSIRTELFTKKHKNNPEIGKSSGTVRRDKIQLVRFSSKFHLGLIVSLYSFSNNNLCLITISLKFFSIKTVIMTGCTSAGDSVKIIKN